MQTAPPTGSVSPPTEQHNIEDIYARIVAEECDGAVVGEEVPTIAEVRERILDLAVEQAARLERLVIAVHAPGAPGAAATLLDADAAFHIDLDQLGALLPCVRWIGAAAKQERMADSNATR